MTAAPPRRQTLRDAAAEVLAERIAAGDWPVGGKLPTEPALCEALGVSRTVLREAVAALKSQGLLESRQGSGVYVLRRDVPPSFSIDDAGLARIEALRGLMELRFAVELDAARLAALRRSTDQLRALRQAQAAVSAAVDDTSLCIPADIAFHEALAAAAGNPQMQQVLGFVLGRLAAIAAEAAPVTDQVPGRAGEIRAEHDALVAAIAEGDAEAARRAAWQHQMAAAQRMGIRGLLAWENLRMAHLPDTDPAPDPCVSDPPAAPTEPLPEGTVDTHVTLIGDPEAYPMIPSRSYAPRRRADMAAYDRYRETTGIARAVFIQPSIYGADNRMLLDALAAAGSDRARGVAMVLFDTPEAELERMHCLGVRGARVNLLYRNGVPRTPLADIATRIAPLGWHIDLQADVTEVPEYRLEAERLKVPLVVDHMGHVPCDLGVKSRGFQDLLALLREGRVWVRLSGFSRLTTRRSLPFSDLRPMVKALVATAPERLIWGSNWPQPAVEFSPPSEIAQLEQLRDWFGDGDLFRRILVENPERLYWP